MGTAPKPPKPETPAVKVAIGDLVLDRYRVVEQIASGGHSVVFRGLDERLSRPVCIKVFSGLGGKSGVGRTSYEHFVQEAFALSRLTHPNTLRIYDFGHLGSSDAAGEPTDSDGMPLQVCEFMNGGTLSQIVREQGNQSLAETARVIGAMCAALGEAHALGIVHRDIKPQNILFGSVGGNKLPKLADFGIAKWSVDDSGPGTNKRAEDTAIVAGQKLAMYSPSWAAPEQLAGQPVSAATDIYSLAVVAVYMMSGRAIFADEDVYAGYRKRRHADEHVAEALAPKKIPSRVIALLVKALEFEPKHRLGSVEELSRGLAGEAPSEPSHRPSDPGDALTTPTVPSQAITPPAGLPVASSAADRSPTPPPMHRPFVVQAPTAPWMASEKPTGPRGEVLPLPLQELPHTVGDRSVHFVYAQNNVADLAGGPNKVRLTFLNGPTGARVLHLKGMSCFVAHLGGRPSPAVQIEQPGDIALVTPRAQEVGHIRVANGAVSNHQLVFTLGSAFVAVSSDDCTDPILFDFGPGSDAYFVYTRGRAIPKLRRR